MRAYRYDATEATIAALRRLRRAWAGYHVAPDALVVALADGGAVRVAVEAADVEPQLEAVRLTAELLEALPRDVPLIELAPPDAFGAGGNDVVLFRSETWIEAPDPEAPGAEADDRVVQYTGSPLQRSATAVAVCAVDDAAVVATPLGTGFLLRSGLQPGTLDVVRDAAAIARFLTERHYGPGAAED